MTKNRALEILDELLNEAILSYGETFARQERNPDEHRDKKDRLCTLVWAIEQLKSDQIKTLGC